MGSRLDQVRRDIARMEAARQARLQEAYENAGAEPTEGPPEAQPDAPPPPEGFSIPRAATSVDTLKGSNSPFTRDGEGTLPLMNDPTMDTAGDRGVSPLLSQDEIAYNLLVDHLRDYPTQDPEELAKLKQRFAREAAARVVKHSAQDQSAPAPTLVYSPERQRAAVRSGAAVIPGTDIRPLRALANGYDAAIDIAESRLGVDLPEVGQGIRNAAWVMAPFALAMTERGISEAENGTGELTEQGYFDKALKMSPYTALAPWVAGKLTDKYPDVEWGSDDHLKWIQKGGDWMDVTDVPGLVLEEQVSSKIRDTIGLDLMKVLDYPADATVAAAHEAVNVAKLPFDYGVLKVAQNVEKLGTALAGDEYDPETAIVPQKLPNPIPGKDDLFKGESRGSKAILNFAVAAPLAMIEPDMISGATLGAGKAVKLGVGQVAKTAGLRIMDLGEKGLVAAGKAFEDSGSIDAAFGALAREIPSIGPIIRDILKTHFAINLFAEGAETGTDVTRAVRAAKDPEAAAKLQANVDKAVKLQDDLNSAWGEVDTALDALETAHRNLTGSNVNIRTPGAPPPARVAASMPQGTVREASDRLKAAERVRKGQESLEARQAAAMQAKAAELGEKRLAHKEAQAAYRRAQADLAKAEARVTKTDGALNEALGAVPNRKKLTKAHNDFKKALADRRKIAASFDDLNSPGAKKALEAVDRRVQQTSKRWKKAQKNLSEPPKASSLSVVEGATKRRVDAALRHADARANLDATAAKAASAEAEYQAAKNLVTPEVAAKYKHFPAKRLEKEIKDLGAKIKANGKVDPMDLNRLVNELEYVKAKTAYDAVYAAATRGLTPAEKRVFARAIKSKGSLKAASKVDDAFRQAIETTRKQLRNYREFIRTGAGTPSVATNWDRTTSAISRAIQVSEDTGLVTIKSVDDLVMDLTQRYGKVPDGMQTFIEKGGGTVAEFQDALRAEGRAAQATQQAAGRPFQAGQILDDTIVQRTGSPGGRLLNAEALAVGARRLVGRLGLLGPLAARGLGQSGEVADAVYRTAYELNRNGELQMTKILKEGGGDALDEFLFSTNPVNIGGVRMSGNVGSAPITRARQHLKDVAAAGWDAFREDTAIRGMAAANIASTNSGEAGFNRALKSLFDTVQKPGFTDDALKTWLRETAPRIHKATHGAADTGGRALMFQSRSIMAAANYHDVVKLAGDAGWIGAASPPDGSLAKAIDFVVTRGAGSPTLDRGLAQDITKEALQESLDFMQRFHTGAASSRAVKPGSFGLGVLGLAVKGVDAKNQAVALSTYAGRKLFVPDNVAKALRDIPDKIVKETEQYAGSGEGRGALQALGELYDSLARTLRMTLVGGSKIPRTRLIGGTQLGDIQQMVMHPDVGPVMAANVASVALPKIVPGGEAVMDALRGSAVNRPLFVSGLDDSLMAVVRGEDRLVQVAEGPIGTKALQREAELQGVVDSLPQKDLYSVLAKNPEAQKGAIDWVSRNLLNPFQQSDLVKLAMQKLEHEQHMKRLALYLELRKTHAPEQAGKIMRDTLFDWSLGVAPWEVEGIFKWSAFHTYRRGKWNLMWQVVERDLAGIEKGRAMSILMPGTAMPMKGARAMSLPSKMRDWDLQGQELTDKEQYDARIESERSGYGSRSVGLLDSSRPSDAYVKGYKDRTGRDVSAVQLYIVQGVYEDILQDEILAYDLLTAAGNALSGGDYQTNAGWQVMGYELATRLVESAKGDPMTTEFYKDAVLGALGIDDPYESSAASQKRNGVRVPKNMAGIASVIEEATGADILGTELGPDDKIIYSLDANWAQYATRLAFMLPGALNDLQRIYGTADTPYWEDGYGKGLVAMMALNLTMRAEMVDAEKQIDMKARTTTKKIQDEIIETENRAFPEMKGRR